MITIFRKEGGAIISSELASKDEIPASTIWIDVINPNMEEESNLESKLGIDIPTGEEIWKNHVLNRLYTENGVSYMTAAIITKGAAPYPQTSSVTFIVCPQYLLTIRSIAPNSFANFTKRLLSHPGSFPTGYDVLEGLMEEVITRVAHNSELVIEDLDVLSHKIFISGSDANDDKSASQMMKEVLLTLGTCTDLNSKINESLHSISRMLWFFKDIKGISNDVSSGIGVLISDAKALSQQTAFLSAKITFQLDATLGMINVEQNLIMKIVSMVTVFFLPPTLISSVYGMNFRSMPELSWQFGYPMAVLMIFAVAIAPYMYFKKKGWL